MHSVVFPAPFESALCSSSFLQARAFTFPQSEDKKFVAAPWPMKCNLLPISPVEVSHHETHKRKGRNIDKTTALRGEITGPH